MVDTPFDKSLLVDERTDGWIGRWTDRRIGWIRHSSPLSPDDNETKQADGLFLVEQVLSTEGKK